MRPLLPSLLAAFAFATASSAFAHVTVSNPWARATVAQQQASGVFMDLRSAHDDAQLVGVKTDAASTAEVHEMRMEDNVMKMRAVPSVKLPNGQAVSLKPGGYHIMLMGLKKPLVAGENVDLTLEVVHADGAKESIAVSAPIRTLAPAAAGQPAAAGGHQHQH